MDSIIMKSNYSYIYGYRIKHLTTPNQQTTFCLTRLHMTLTNHLTFRPGQIAYVRTLRHVHNLSVSTVVREEILKN